MSFRASKLLASGVALVVAMATLGAAPSPKSVTVGQFAVRLARSLGFSPQSGLEARDRLSDLGLNVGADLEAPLTEGRAVGLLRGFGVDAVTSGDPTNLVTGSRADQLTRNVSEAVLSTPAPEALQGGIPPSCQNFTLSQCFNCCVALLTPYSRMPQRVINLCAASCTAIGAPPASMSYFN